MFDTALVPIKTIQHSFQLDGGQFAISAARSAGNGSVVIVETSVPVTGTLTVTVDQSSRSI